MTAAMIERSITEPEQLPRLVEFAGDVAELANDRRDAELHELVSELHADLVKGDEDE